MKIGIDIDGVLTDINRFQMDYGGKFSYEKHLNGIVNPDELNITEILQCSKKETSAFWHKNLKFYKKKKYTREFASEIIRKIKKQGNEIHIITARKECERKWTTKWLKENKISYDALIMTEEKLEYCIENNIDLMVEDNVENIAKISAKIPVLCFDNVWNKKYESKNVIRCYNWYDIYKETLNHFKEESNETTN